MKHKLLIILLLVSVVWVMVAPVAAQSQSGPRVLSSGAQADFPTRLNFSLSASGDSQITDVRVRYEVERTGFARVTAEVAVPFTPGTQVDAGYTLDMRFTGGLPPGTAVRYWWLLTDAGGRVTTSEVKRVDWHDARYAWRSLSEGQLTIYWYAGNDAFAREMMAAAQAALPRLGQDTGTLLSSPVSVYLYNGSGDLQGAMVFPSEWTGGAAYPDYGIITLGVSPVMLDWGKRTVAHELAHLVVHQLTDNPYLDIPVWLDEGMAMYAEGPLEGQFTTSFRRAVAADRLFTVRTLSSPFSALTDQAVLAYAQSFSIVDYLIGTYGQSRMLELLGVFRQGSDYDAALLKVYGFDTDGLNRLWRDYVRSQYLAGAATPAQPELAGAVR
ncbi:MAG: peptidase MA domain-containing protein [Dehalococcoidia bacterium]|nr:MAG: peptidase MA domain-containing protein [Dehalococcoidia bacterium]